MTPEELDKATADEAWRLLEEGQDVAVIAARLAREGWTLPEPVMDPELDRVTEDEARRLQEQAQALRAFAARLAREQEQERANNPLVVFAVRVSAGVFIDLDEAKRHAAKALAAYKAGKAAQ